MKKRIRRAGVCVVISEITTWVNTTSIDGSRSLNRSRNLKFEKFPKPDSKNFSTGAVSESEKVIPASGDLCYIQKIVTERRLRDSEL